MGHSTRLRVLAAAALAGFAVFCAPAWPAPSGPISLRTIATGFALPVELARAGDGSGRLFVVEQAGRIRILRDGQVLPTPFLDLGTLVQTGGEQGLLGLAFHPGFAVNGLFYLFHNTAPDPPNGGSDIVVARYRASGDVADASSRAEILRIAHPTFINHNGGKLAFGPDGYLYIAVGDGGGGGDPFGAGQNLADLRGKLLRIDVDGASPYAIPPGNPFQGQPGARPEIFAYGLRNPWRFSFDRANGDLYIGDVGQALREEIDFVPGGSAGGQNFGWNVFEGTLCYEPPSGCSLPGHVPPLSEYAHNAGGGFSVTGGFVYRGAAFPELAGYYLYGDYVSGRIWSMPGGGAFEAPTQVASLVGVSAFGEDDEGGLYAADHDTGSILRVESPALVAAVRQLATRYYQAILGRAPDAAGLEFWESEAVRLRGLGADASEVFLVMAGYFFNSIEYASLNTTDAQFIADLYETFLDRPPDDQGRDYWSGQIQAGLPREVVLFSFMFAPEFRAHMAGIFGDTAARPEVDMAVDFFRGLLNRLPDTRSLNYWLARLRAAQCAGAGPVYTAVEEISRAFMFSPEYGNRGRDNTQLVTDMYYTFLRRGGDLAGVRFWIEELQSGARTADRVRQDFIATPEFGARVASVIAAGCLP